MESTRARTTMFFVIAALTLVGISMGVVHISRGAASSSRFTGPADPVLQACQAAHRICDPEAEATRIAASPPAQPPSARPVYLIREVIEDVARRAAHTALTSEAPLTAAVYSALMTRPAFEALTHEGHNAAVNPNRMVWLVTVHAPMATDGGRSRPPQVFPVYSVVYDAETGHWTDVCIGCAWLQQSQ